MSEIYTVLGNNFYGIFLSKNALESKTAGKTFVKNTFTNIGDARTYIKGQVECLCETDMRAVEVNKIYYFRQKKDNSVGNKRFYALWAREGFGVFEGESRAINAGFLLNRAKIVRFSCFEDAREQAISAYNDLQKDPMAFFVEDTIPVNFVIFRSKIRKAAANHTSVKNVFKY